MPKMGVNPEQTKAAKPVPAGWYELRVKAGVVKMSKSGKGYNYEFYTEVVNNKAELNGSFVPMRANNGFNQAKVVNDFAHACGFELEKDGSIPGDWKLKDPAKKLADGSDDFNNAQYSGPLLGKVFRAELAVGNWDGEDRNEVKQMQCKIQDCVTKNPEIKHLTDIRGKK
jgi:hypothetical protein